MKVGSEVKIRTVDGQFGGFVYAVDQQQQYLTLRDGKHHLAHLTCRHYCEHALSIFSRLFFRKRLNKRKPQSRFVSRPF